MAQTIIMALLPVFLVVMLGYWFQRSAFFGEGFWEQSGRLTYYVLLPLLFFKSIALAPLHEISVFPAATVCAAAILLVGLLLLLCRKWITPSRPSFATVFQGGIRFNNYIATSVAALLFAKQGVLYAAIFTALLVPLVNTLAVVVLSLFGSKHAHLSLRQLLLKILTNPLILSCIAGVLVNVSRVPIPAIALDVVTILSQGALPLGLLAVGAGMLEEKLRFNRRIVIGLCTKLLILPLVALALCYGFEIRGLTAQVAILMCCVPGATSSYVLARQLGADAPLAARLLSLQTLFAMATMPLMLYLAMRL